MRLRCWRPVPRRLPGQTPVGAGNSAVVVDVPRCGPMLSPRVPNLVPIPGITGSAHCAVRPLQGPRDHRVAPPTRCAASTGRPTRAHRHRPQLARSDCGRARATEPSRVAGHPRHAVALAPAPHRRTLDPTTATAGPTIDLSRDSPTRTAPRSRESDLGIPPHPRRTCRARPHHRSVNYLADPQQRRNRPRTHTLGSHLVAVPAVPGRRRLRLRHHRNRHAAQVLPAVLHRHPHPNRVLRTDHRPPQRRLDHPSRPEPVAPTRPPTRRRPGRSCATAPASSSTPSTRSSEPKAARSSRHLCALPWRTRSPNAGSAPCDANSSTAPSSRTAANSTSLSSTTSIITTRTGPTVHSISDHPSPPTLQTSQIDTSKSLERPAVVDSSTSTEMPPDQPRHSFRHPRVS